MPDFRTSLLYCEFATRAVPRSEPAERPVSVSLADYKAQPSVKHTSESCGIQTQTPTVVSGTYGRCVSGREMLILFGMSIRNSPDRQVSAPNCLGGHTTSLLTRSSSLFWPCDTRCCAPVGVAAIIIIDAGNSQR